VGDGCVLGGGVVSFFHFAAEREWNRVGGGVFYRLVEVLALCGLLPAQDRRATGVSAETRGLGGMLVEDPKVCHHDKKNRRREPQLGERNSHLILISNSLCEKGEKKHHQFYSFWKRGNCWGKRSRKKKGTATSIRRFPEKEPTYTGS